MRKQRIPARPPRRATPPGPFRAALASALLLIGMAFTRVGQACSDVGRLWMGEFGTRLWARAFQSFSSGQAGRHVPAWERSLLRIGPPVLYGIGAALGALVALLVLGGGVAWLVVHGYGVLLFAGALLAGVLVGLRRAALVGRMPQHDRTN